jgi:hypothetical protein
MTDPWEQDAIDFGWVMPTAPRWKRLPVIRHVRAIWLSGKVARQTYAYIQFGFIPSGYDKWVLRGIWIGKERDHD